MNRPKLSVLIAARKNSKYLAKFLFGLYANTADPERLEILIMLNENDTWNRDLVSFFEWRDNVTFIYEDYQLGRAGLHKYFNELAKLSTGEWLIYFCEDHYINPPSRLSWDQYFFSRILELQMDYREPYVLVPKFDNAGAMNHMISRGFYEAIGNVVGRHGWIDSYINDITAAAWGRLSPRLVRMDTETFHDFTHDQPSPMDDSHLQSVISDKAKTLPKHGDEVYKHRVALDAEKLKPFKEVK